MTADTLRRHLDWMSEGHRYFLARLEELSEDDLGQPLALPGWTGRHLLAHVGHNARALARLAYWASSGVPTPMYVSASARSDEIQLGAEWPVAQLRSFVAYEQDQLVVALDKLSGPSWRAEVVTAQGRSVPASTIPWLRCRELWVHATDLRQGNGFEDMPPEFVDDLLLDVLICRRHGSGSAVAVRAVDRSRPGYPHDDGVSRVEGRAAELARWLTGRGGAESLRTTDGAPLPELPPWL